MIHANLTVLSLISGTILPFVVGLVTKRKASSTVKFVVNAVLSAIGGVLVSAIAASGTIVIHDAILNAGLAFATSLAAYHGAWKPLGTAATVAALLPSFGIGPKTPPPPALVVPTPGYVATDNTGDAAS